MHVEAYDLADGTSGTIAIAPPADRTGSEPTCTWSLDGGTLPPAVSIAGCSLQGAFPRLHFNNAVLSVDVALPPDYACGDSVISGCFLSAVVDTAGAVRNDTSTWSARVL